MSQSQKKTLRLLVGILIVLVVILAVVMAVRHFSAQKAAEEEEAAKEDVITEEDAEYTSLSYNNGTTTLSFHLDESGTWVWSDDPEFPLDDSTIQSMMVLLTTLTPQQTITDGDSLESYGLDQPTATLTATKADGETLTIALGDTTVDGDSYYMLMNGQESPVYIISDSLHTYMSRTIYDMCQLPELPDLTEESIQSVSIAGAVTTELSQSGERTEPDPDTGEDTVVLTWSAGGEDVTSSEDAQALLTEVRGLSISKCVDYKPTDEAVSLCGFDAPQATLTVTYLTETGTESSFTLTIAGENLDASGYYVRLDDDTTIYQVSTTSVDTILSIAAGGLTADAAAEE